MTIIYETTHFQKSFTDLRDLFQYSDNKIVPVLRLIAPENRVYKIKLLGYPTLTRLLSVENPKIPEFYRILRFRIYSQINPRYFYISNKFSRKLRDAQFGNRLILYFLLIFSTRRILVGRDLPGDFPYSGPRIVAKYGGKDNAVKSIFVAKLFSTAHVRNSRFISPIKKMKNKKLYLCNFVSSENETVRARRLFERRMIDDEPYKLNATVNRALQF